MPKPETNVQRKVPHHETIYKQIRDLILCGGLVPGQAVTIQGLAQRIEAGATPVREALRRLTADGALAALDNRRIAVPELGRKDLEELRFLRLSIEPELGRRAAGSASGRLVSALKSCDARLNAAIAAGDVQSYLTENYRFHFSLYEAADAQIMTSMARKLWLRAGPSLRIVCGRIGTANLPDKHAETIVGLERGDAGAVGASIREDILQGLDLISAALDEIAVAACP